MSAKRSGAAMMGWTAPLSTVAIDRRIDAQPQLGAEMTRKVVGLDIAKNVFQVHGVSAQGEIVVRQRLRRSDVLRWFAEIDQAIVGIEACRNAHYWARELVALGHHVRLMPPQFVKPYVKSQKNDVADAEAICEAVQRPTMRFVPIKSADQQAALLLHRTRDLLIRAVLHQSPLLLNRLVRGTNFAVFAWPLCRQPPREAHSTLGR